jgi:hypothetical protein
VLELNIVLPEAAQAGPPSAPRPAIA